MKNKTCLITSLFTTGILFLTGCTVSDVEWHHNHRQYSNDARYAWMMVDIYRGKPVHIDGLYPVLFDLPEKPDEEKAFEWLKTAADIGDAKACFEIGKMYALGTGTTKDSEQAASYFDKCYSFFRRDVLGMTQEIYPAEARPWASSICDFFLNNDVDVQTYGNALRWTITFLNAPLEYSEIQTVNKAECDNKAQALVDKYLDDVLTINDIYDQNMLLEAFAIYSDTAEATLNENRRIAMEKAKEAELKAKQEKIASWNEARKEEDDDRAYKNSNKIILAGDIYSGKAMSIAEEDFRSEEGLNHYGVEMLFMENLSKLEDLHFCLGYYLNDVYYGCVSDRKQTLTFYTQGSYQIEKRKENFPEAYAFASVRYFDDVTLDDVVGAVEKKYPGLKRTDRKVPVKSIIRGTVYLADYNLPQIVLENDKMKVIIQQLNAVSIPDVKVKRLQADDPLYRLALKDGETYQLDANTAGNLYQATDDISLLLAAGTKVSDPAGIAFVESKRSTADLAEQLKKYGCVKNLYGKSNNAYFREYADKFAGAKLSPMFDLAMTLENRMFLQEEKFLSTCIKNVDKKKSTIANAFDNAFEQFMQIFGSNLTKGGKNKFVLVIYDKAMWEPVKQYYNVYLQKQKQQEEEAKQKKLSL